MENMENYNVGYYANSCLPVKLSMKFEKWCVNFNTKSGRTGNFEINWNQNFTQFTQHVQYNGVVNSLS